MTQYAEVVYEGGDHSVVSFENESELQSALAEQHRRALAGEDAGPAGGPASRVKKVYLYDEHPTDATPVGNDGNMPVDAKAVTALVTGMTNKKGQLNMHQMVAALRDEASPVYPVDPGKHESYFKADSNSEMKLDFLPKDEA